MKKLLYLFAICIICSSCAVIYGDNYDNSKKIQQLHIGMSKQDAISIMGDKYIVESTSQEENGVLEIIKYYSQTEVPYLLHFLNGQLVLFNRYYSPYIPEQKIIIKQDKE
ncbi:MAG: outer membrane protein assembly factor BamE [Prevotella sp.]|jgi:hypothetical protein|nr:outer membrane protein assembly factor BamE [Prevotella sp.]